MTKLMAEMKRSGIDPHSESMQKSKFESSVGLQSANNWASGQFTTTGRPTVGKYKSGSDLDSVHLSN